MFKKPGFHQRHKQEFTSSENEHYISIRLIIMFMLVLYILMLMSGPFLLGISTVLLLFMLMFVLVLMSLVKTKLYNDCRCNSG